MTFKLTHYRLCPRSRSIRLALAEFGIEASLVEETPWELRQNLLALNPAGEMPVLELAKGLVLCGAYSISEFIAEDVVSNTSHMRPPDLFPGNRDERAEVRRLIDWFHGKMHREVTRELLVPVGPLVRG